KVERRPLALILPSILAGLGAVALSPHFVKALLKLGDAFLGQRKLVGGQRVGMRVLLRRLRVRGRYRENARKLGAVYVPDLIVILGAGNRAALDCPQDAA